MLLIRDFMEDHISWDVNLGNISLVWDNWLGSGHLGRSQNFLRDLLISEFLDGHILGH